MFQLPFPGVDLPASVLTRSFLERRDFYFMRKISETAVRKIILYFFRKSWQNTLSSVCIGMRGKTRLAGMEGGELCGVIFFPAGNDPHAV
jgi:hypothetical protein